MNVAAATVASMPATPNYGTMQPSARLVPDPSPDSIDPPAPDWRDLHNPEPDTPAGICAQMWCCTTFWLRRLLLCRPLESEPWMSTSTASSSSSYKSAPTPVTRSRAPSVSSVGMVRASSMREPSPAASVFSRSVTPEPPAPTTERAPNNLWA